MENRSKPDFLAEIRQENLTVYRSSPQRLREDVGQEAQISQDYRGRLIYELLQNADDAMEEGDPAAKICLRLTPDALWMANSGRPLDEPDIRGLCGISASSKGLLGKKRASIGHKGMGFKSVLEITDAPEVYSITTSFRFSPADALNAVQSLVDGGRVPPVGRAPICRFPWGTEGDDPTWREFRERGFRTAFRFPLRPKDKDTQFAKLGEALRTLPESSLLFLKRLKCVEIEFVGERNEGCIQWTVGRQRHDPSGARVPVNSLFETGVYSVHLTNGREPQFQFILAYDSEIPIGQNRGGLNDFAWEGVELTEAAIAARVTDGKAAELPPAWRRLHVFLPSAEPCPYELLISAAFNSNLSRQEIKVEQSSEDYNRFLLARVAAIFRDHLLPALLHEGVDRESLLRLLRRRNDSENVLGKGAANAVYEAFKIAFKEFPLVPTECQELVPIPTCAVPPLVKDAKVGVAFRQVLSDKAGFREGVFPVSQYCGGDLARILVDHGAYELTPAEAAGCLSDPDPERSKLREHSSSGVNVDPVLSVLEGLKSGLDFLKQDELVRRVRRLPLFPVGVVDGRVTRIATKDLQCFYPPRSLKGKIGLSGLCFLLQDLCWGALTPAERNVTLAKEMPIWQALFELHEFKFPDVMRASVLPALDLDSAPSDPRRTQLRSLEALTEICQLAGRMPDGSKPLPYERLGPNRALFNLSRLDVPCRSDTDDGIKWVPAYRAYFGQDWLPEESFELVCKAVASVGREPPAVDFLVGPSRFVGLLDRFRHLRQATEESEDLGDEEVAIDEDEETALDSDERGRWEEFFRWLGVNGALRAVHFHDVEDRAQGWLKTRGLRRPDGWAFANIPIEKWRPFLAMVAEEIQERRDERPDALPYFYQLHDLEHIVQLLDVAAADASARVARALYEHFVRNWGTLERFTSLEIALVAGEPQRRTKPPRARGEEIVTLDECNFWVYRLQRAAACPTTHGPRLPSEAWTPTQEVMRRFGRKSRDGIACLLPTLDLPDNLPKGRLRGLAQAMHVRDELSQGSFTEADALVVLNRLKEIFAPSVARGDDLRQALREVIRPAYRNLLELLAGMRKTSVSGLLTQAPLLAHDGVGHFAFRPASEVLYVARLDTRDRLQTDAPIWTFVLEAFNQGRGALTDVFSCRVLEDSLRWSPDAGDPALIDSQKAEWQARLRELAPFILARVGAERVDETLARRDTVLLRNLILSLEPVVDLRLKCSLDGAELPSRAIDREAFVEVTELPTGRLTAFVRWSEHAWPPLEDDAEALATAFGEVLGAGYFESFLALIRAPTNARRENLLRRAGAPTDIEEYRLRLFVGDSTGDTTESPIQPPLAEEPRTAAGHEDGERPAQQPKAGPLRSTDTRQVPLYSIEQIVVDGVPVHLTGVPGGESTPKPSPPRNATSPEDGSENGDDAGGYGGHTDLESLNRLGMAITLAYEVVRLQKAGCSAATVFDPAQPGPQPSALVFDVSSPSRVAKARAACPHFEVAFKRLIELHRVPPEWLGFDVLTLDPANQSEPQRVIELKSSGVCARVQEMSWNEWKTARSSELRKRFYLYLVGNLRSDLNDSKPFIRTIRDPFEQLMAEILVNKRVDRKVQLAVSQFREAEHLDLTVRAAAPPLGK